MLVIRSIVVSEATVSLSAADVASGAIHTVASRLPPEIPAPTSAVGKASI